MLPVFITGIGPVAGFGSGVKTLRHVLTVGGRPEDYQVDLQPLEQFLSRRVTRRIDRFSQIGLLGAHLALQDAGLLGTDLSRVGLVVVSGYGPLRTTFAFLDTVIEDGDNLASPTHFSNSVHNAAAAHIGIQLGMTGPSLSLSQFELSVAAGLQAAQCWLAEQRVDAVLFGAIDERCPVVDYCYQRYFPDMREELRPWNLSEQSAQAGEGGCFLVLQSETSATQSYARLHSIEVSGCLESFAPGESHDCWLLGCDGHANLGPIYAQILPGPRAVAAYAGLYGALPVGGAFDVAIAALGLQQGHLFACDPMPPELPWKPAGELRGVGVSCLKLAAGGGWGRIRLTAS